MKTKHWDIKRTRRENWTAADWSMHKFVQNLQVRGFIDSAKFYLVIYDPIHPSRTTILREQV